MVSQSTFLPATPPLSSWDFAAIVDDESPPFAYSHTTRTPLKHISFDIPARMDASVKVDMGMAETGSLAAAPGYTTSLATYTAQMVVWLWFGEHPSSNSPILDNPFDPSRTPISPVDRRQLLPSQHFTHFVARLLQITMVSHSVTLLALLYIYRLTTGQRWISGGPGSEQRVFVASLILGNKYLDDNTYTNGTWAQLSGMPLTEINDMEKEFLEGVKFNLGVTQAEYQQWKSLLDGFIYAKESEARRRSTFAYTPSYSNISPLWPTPEMSYRARSASPLPVLTPPQPSSFEQPHAFPSPNIYPPRKRSAVAAFSGDVPIASVYEQMRLPSKKPQVDLGYQHTSTRIEPTPSGLGRSSSLSRQIARLPQPGSRRGSVGHMLHGEPDLRHAATTHAAQMQDWNQKEVYAGGYRSLAAPFERNHTQIPPDQLMFYSLAADPHIGYDGSLRKAVLRYQDPSLPPYQYPSILPRPYTTAYAGDDTMLDISPTTLPPQLPPHTYPYSLDPSYRSYGVSPNHQIHRTHQAPQPGAFANAGPPGWVYDPHQQQQQQQQQYRQLPPPHSYPPQIRQPTLPPPSTFAPNQHRWSTASEDLLPAGYEVNQQQPLPWIGSRSEWSSPMPGYEGNWQE